MQYVFFEKGVCSVQWGPVVKVGVARGAQPTLLRLGPHLLKSEPGLLIAEIMLLQQQYDIYFFVSEQAL